MDKMKQLLRSQHNGMDRPFDISDLATSFEAMDNTVESPFTMAREVKEVNFGMESFGSLSVDTAQSMQSLYSEVDSRLRDMGLEGFNKERGGDAERVTGNQVTAAVLSMMAHNDEVKYKKALRGVTTALESNEPNVALPPMALEGVGGTVQTLSTGLENYNEKSQRDFKVISMAYNLAAARQDAFGEAIYPTVVVNPTEGGVTQNLTYAAILQDVYHNVTGALWDTREVNMVEAFRDPEVLEDNATHIYPTVEENDKNLANFVPNAKVAHKDIVLDNGQTITTAPLAIGKKFDLLALSNRNVMASTGQIDLTDTIDPSLRLKAIYVETAQGVLKFKTERMPRAVFQPNLTDDTRIANLNFLTEDLVIDADTTNIDGSKGSALTDVASRDITLRVGVGVSGNISLSRGNTSIAATPASVETITDSDGLTLDQESAANATLLSNLGEMKVIGYDLDARFTNTNRRERGQLVQSRTVQFRYPIPMHSPITMPMSTMDEGGPGDVVKTLTVATNIRNSNNAVARLLNYAEQLREIVGSGVDRPKFGAIEGAMSIMMRPTYKYKSLDLLKAIDTIRSSDRQQDVSQTILNAIKGILYPAYRESNIESAFQTITGNADERPKFIIATDREIAHYLMTTGDDRTLGPYLKYDIVATNNRKFDGKIMVIPTRERPVENDVLNFGQFYYVPTIVADLPISRNGQISREIAAVPFNTHVNNIPFMIELDVTGLTEVMGTSRFNQLDGFQTTTLVDPNAGA